LDAARESGVALEAEHVVGLPAVQRDGGLFQGLNGLVGVDAEGGIALAGQFVGFLEVLCVHILLFLEQGLTSPAY